MRIIGHAVMGSPWAWPAVVIVAVAGAGYAGPRWALLAMGVVVFVGGIMLTVLMVAGRTRRDRTMSALSTPTASDSALVATTGHAADTQSRSTCPPRTDLRGARLTNARLVCADLRGADLCGADLTHADLTGALLGPPESGTVGDPANSNHDPGDD